VDRVLPTAARFAGWRGASSYAERAKPIESYIAAAFSDLASTIARAPFDRVDAVPRRQPPMLLAVGTRPATVALATSAPPVRRKRGAEGRSIPVSNALIGSRHDILSYHG